MVGQIIAALRRSPLVKDLEVIEVVEGERVRPSGRVSVEEVLAELAAMLKSKGQVR